MEKLLEALEHVDINADCFLSDEAWDAFEELVLGSHAPEKAIGQDRPCERKDFEEFIPIVEQNLTITRSFLKKLSYYRTNRKRERLRLKKSLVVLLLSLCGEHSEQYVWNSEMSISCAHEILDITLSMCGCTSVKNILVKEKNHNAEIDALFKQVLLSLRPKLLKETWKLYPAAVASFSWLLHHVKSPHLSDHLSSVLPTALILADDFIPSNRLLGIKCLHHIVDNVPRSQLCWYGQAEVVYEAVFKTVYHTEDMLVEPVLACLTLIVDKLESGPEADDRKFEWTRRDDVLQLVLQQMALQQQLVLRRAYSRALPALARPMGPALARHTQAIVRVLCAYFETALYDHHGATLHALEMVHILCEQCGPRMAAHGPALAAALLRLLADACDAGPTAPPPAVASLATPAVAALRALLGECPSLAARLRHELLPPSPAVNPPLAGLLSEALDTFLEECAG